MTTKVFTSRSQPRIPETGMIAFDIAFNYDTPQERWNRLPLTCLMDIVDKSFEYEEVKSAVNYWREMAQVYPYVRRKCICCKRRAKPKYILCGSCYPKYGETIEYDPIFKVKSVETLISEEVKTEETLISEEVKTEETLISEEVKTEETLISEEVKTEETLISEIKNRKTMVRGSVVQLNYGNNNYAKVCKRINGGWLKIKIEGEDNCIKVRTSSCRYVNMAERMKNQNKKITQYTWQEKLLMQCKNMEQ